MHCGDCCANFDVRHDSNFRRRALVQIWCQGFLIWSGGILLVAYMSWLLNNLIPRLIGAEFVYLSVGMGLTPKGRSPFCPETVDSDIVWC